MGGFSNMQGLIYVADDEKNIRDLLESFLVEAGHMVKVFADGESLLCAFLEKEPTLVILDVMMPDVDGFTVCNKIRKISEVPIILLTARDTDADYITGFTAGCDDYFTKPFSPLKLTMRVNAIIKRALKAQQITQNKILVLEDIVLDQGMKSCTINEQNVKLTNTEFELMAYLMANKDKAVSRGELLNTIWGYGAEVETRVTDDIIKRIRKKLRDYKSKVSIETVWGYGFKIGRKDV